MYTKEFDESWQCTYDSDYASMYERNCDLGEWVLDVRNDKGIFAEPTKIKFTPKPETDNFALIYHRYQALVTRLENLNLPVPKEVEKLRVSTGSPIEIGYAHNFTEAKMLVNSLEEGDANLPDIETMLKDAGFVYKYTVGNNNDCKIYDHTTKPRLGISIRDNGSIHCTFDVMNRGNPCWLNLGKLDADRESDYKPGRWVYFFYPDAVIDQRKILIKHIAEVTKLRTERGGLFKKHLLPDQVKYV